MTTTEPASSPLSARETRRRTPAEESAARLVLNLDGEWAFLPYDVPASEVADRDAATITVPGLWEAQEWRDLDGPAWYLRTFDVPTADGRWTLRFGAVMDEAEVHLNGQLVGRHVGGYTPFAYDVTPYLRSGRNELAVRVVDLPPHSKDHLRSAHGKQGWKNDVFPSPPSLYMSYGGIWQSVTLTGHDAVTVKDVFVNGDAAGGQARIRVCNRGPRVTAVVQCTVAGELTSEETRLDAGSEEEVRLPLDLSGLATWWPDDPTLHWADVKVLVGDVVRDERRVRFGVRTVEVQGDQILVNGRPRRVKAALVQGFRPDTLYAEATRDDIEQEVLAAKALGLNMLRLHIKAFDPVYLDVCDELGMLVQCDVPVAEPLAVDELDDTGVLADNCLRAATEQVTRDRNHPSIVLWTAMNEIGADDLWRQVRATSGYRRFVNLLYDAILELDGTRPVIENDFTEASPDCVYRSPILTAHWYGRLMQQYLTDVLAKTRQSVDPQKVLLVTEFGDWALPSLADAGGHDVASFWDPAQLREDVNGFPWPRSVEEFVVGTQRYKGIADRLQIELFRRVPGIAGWCLTQLTDVPHEYNGLWEFDRTPKPEVLRQVAAACRTTLPMALHVRPDPSPAAAAPEPPQPLLGAWNGWTGEDLHLSMVVSHDDDTSVTGTVTATIGSTGEPARVELALIPHSPTPPLSVVVPLPPTPGRHDLVLDLAVEGMASVRNAYDVHVFERPTLRGAASLIGSPRDAAAIAAAGTTVGGDGPLVVGEAAANAASLPEVEAALDSGRNVVLLAQTPTSAKRLPMAASMADIATEWGSVPFLFSTHEALLSAVPAGTVVTTELLSITPRYVYTSLAGGGWPERLVLGMYKPDPGRFAAPVVGAVPVRAGLVWFCQLPLVDAVLADDATAVTTLAEVLCAAAEPVEAAT